MADRSIRIDRLRVRLHGVPPDAAGRLADGLGRALADRLAPEMRRGAGGRASMTRLDIAVAPQDSPGVDPGTRIGDAVAGAIGQRLPGRGSRP